MIQLTNWFISPIHKHLCGDTDEGYKTGMIIEKIKSYDTKWKVKVSGKIYWFKRDDMDTYFVKNHLKNTLLYLKEIEDNPPIPKESSIIIYEIDPLRLDLIRENEKRIKEIAIQEAKLIEKENENFM